MNGQDNGSEDGLVGRVDEEKRSSLRKLIVGTAYAVPVVATFSLNGLAINEAHAYFSNQIP
jgi:hypothetical protein